jgi:hypothetical protein
VRNPGINLTGLTTIGCNIQTSCLTIESWNRTVTFLGSVCLTRWTSSSSLVVRGSARAFFHDLVLSNSVSVTDYAFITSAEFDGSGSFEGWSISANANLPIRRAGVSVVPSQLSNNLAWFIHVDSLDPLSSDPTAARLILLGWNVSSVRVPASVTVVDIRSGNETGEEMLARQAGAPRATRLVCGSDFRSDA